MDDLGSFWDASDGITRAVALLLLAMSISGWVLIVWKAWVLRRAARDIVRGTAAFWDAATLDGGRDRLRAIDREGVLLPLLDAALAQPAGGTLETSGHLQSQLTRRLRDGLHRGARAPAVRPGAARVGGQPRRRSSASSAPSGASTTR